MPSYLFLFSRHAFLIFTPFHAGHGHVFLSMSACQPCVQMRAQHCCVIQPSVQCERMLLICVYMCRLGRCCKGQARPCPTCATWPWSCVKSAATRYALLLDCILQLLYIHHQRRGRIVAFFLQLCAVSAPGDLCKSMTRTGMVSNEPISLGIPIVQCLTSLLNMSFLSAVPVLSKGGRPAVPVRWPGG